MKKNILYLIIGILISSCSKATSNEDNDIAILKEILPIAYEKYKTSLFHLAPPPPPNPKHWVNKKEYGVSKREILRYKKDSIIAEKQRDSIRQIWLQKSKDYFNNDLRFPILIMYDSLPSINKEIYDEKNNVTFRIKNNVTVSIDTLEFNGKFQIIKSSNWFDYRKISIEKTGIREGWRKFYEYTQKYPGRYSDIIFVSRITFSDDKNFGVFNFHPSSSWCGWIGGYCFIKKVDNQWKVDYWK